jgi:uncharacterized protein (DUF983 family)
MKITSDLTNLTTAILILTVQMFFEWTLSVPEMGHFLTCIFFCIVSKIETIETIQNSV